MAATNGSFAAQEQYTATTGAPESNTANGRPNLSKDEIGWYFVEQYYTTLSKNPEKLHLFYGKRSQFVSGSEAEVNTIAVGRAQIQERIKDLDFQDCKVRVSNVDSQGSDENIVIQVIGETSNKNAELKKFVQTFILAEQPSGYFVLNDIFRYIKEEEDEEVVEEAPPAEEPVEMPKQEEAAPTEPLDAVVVDQKLEQTIEEAKPEATEEPKANGVAEPVAEEPKEEEAPTPEAVEKEIAAEASAEVEKPQDPVPTPAAVTRAPSAAKVPAVPAAPPKAMSWANRAAAAAAASAPKPAVPQVKPASPATTTQARAPPAATPTPAAATTPDVKDDKENQNPLAKSDGWQTAGNDAKRQNRPAAAQPQEKEGTMGYIRNVTEGVNADELKAAISKFGEVTYFDINRQKNCAFIEFKDAAGFQAAAKASPHSVGGEDITIEPRRPKSNNFGGQGFNQRGGGGMGGRGRGGFPQQQRGRGDFNNRGRGTPRGRGGAAAPTAS